MAKKKSNVAPHKKGVCNRNINGYKCQGTTVRHQGRVATCTSCNQFAYNVSPGHRRTSKPTCKHGVYVSVCPLGCNK